MAIAMVSTKLNCAFNNSKPKSKKNKKNGDLAFFKGYISPRGISANSTMNAPKWHWSAGTWKFASNATFFSMEAPLD